MLCTRGETTGYCVPVDYGKCTSDADCRLDEGASCTWVDRCLGPRLDAGDAGTGDAGTSDAGTGDAGTGDAGDGG